MSIIMMFLIAAILKNNTCADATYFIDKVAQLYQYEKEAKAMSDEDRLSHRQQFSAPIVKDLDDWIDKKLTTTLPNSALYKALSHAQSRWSAIKVYLTAGNIPIDNNYIEREIRPLTLGRKNWLFFGSYEAGVLMTGIMSLLETAKLNGLNPAEWLLDTLQKLPNWLNNRLDALLPLAPK